MTWTTNFTCFLFLPKACSAIRLKELSTKGTSYHQSSCQPEPLIFFTEALFDLCQRKQWDVGQIRFPCTHKPSSLRLQEQLMNSQEPNLAHLKYYCIVHHNDGNNLVMSVHRAGPCTKPRRSHTPLPVHSEYQRGLPVPIQGQSLLKTQVITFFLTFWPLAMNIESCYPLRLLISFSKRL